MSREIIQNLYERDTVNGSAVLKLARRLPNMTSRQHKIPVLSLLPIAYWQDGASMSAKDIAAKKLTAAGWDKVVLTAEELAVIVLIDENTLDDSEYDLWAQIKPLIVQSIGQKIDEAVLLGAGAPAGAPMGVVPAAIAAGNSLDTGTNADAYEDLLGAAGLLGLLEADGYLPNAYVGDIAARAYLRGIRDSIGDPLFSPTGRGMIGATTYSLDGVPIYFPNNGVLNGTDNLLIGGDFNQLVYSIRQDITVKLLDQASIFDAGTNTEYRLAQQDMVGLRVKFRIAWATPNPINRQNPDAATRFPFAVLTKAAPPPPPSP
jgi:HK97 family phage major capsid protein